MRWSNHFFQVEDGVDMHLNVIVKEMLLLLHSIYPNPLYQQQLFGAKRELPVKKPPLQSIMNTVKTTAARVINRRFACRLQPIPEPPMNDEQIDCVAATILAAVDSKQWLTNVFLNILWSLLLYWFLVVRFIQSYPKRESRRRIFTKYRKVVPDTRLGPYIHIV